MQASQEASDKKAKAKAKKVMPFEEDDRILLLGEGELNLSFLPSPPSSSFSSIRAHHYLPPTSSSFTSPSHPRRRTLAANFSFTHALLVAHPLVSPPHQIVATSFDSEETCYIKYPDAKDLVLKIRELGVPVLFEVDAGDLEAIEEIRKMKGGFTKVVFNFPHVGESTELLFNP